MAPPRVVNSTGRQTSRNRAGRAWILRPVALVAAVALLAVAGCGGSSKPSYCSDRSNLESSVKSDFPTQTSAITSSVDTLDNAVKTLPSSPSAAQVATVGSAAANVASSVKSFSDATSSKCS